MFLALAYFLLIHLTLLIPGYVFIRKTGFFQKSPALELPLAYVATLAFYALLAALTYVLNINPLWSRGLSWLLIGAGIFIFVRDGLWRDVVAKYRFPLVCLAAMSLFSLIFISLPFNAPRTIVPDPTPQPDRNYSAFNVKVLNVAQTQANDNYVPYRQAQFFINRSDPAKDSFIDEWGVNFFVRTPLMGAVTANYFNLLGDRPPVDYTWSSSAQDLGHTYKKFQVLAQVLNTLFIIPAFFIIARLFNKKTAYISLLFMIPSIYFVYNAFFSWPKSLVAFFILTSWLLLLEKRLRATVLAGAVSGVAYLTHDLAVLYIGASFLYLLLNKRFRELVFFTIPTIILALPWLITASVIYHKPSNFIYYPISTEGIPPLGEQERVLDQFLHTSPLKLIKIRIENLAYLLSPYQLLSSEGGQIISNRLWALSLFSIPGALGLGLLVPAFIAVFKKLRSLEIAVFIFVPVILSTLAIGWPKGLGALHFAQAVVVLLIGLSVYFLASLKRKAWLLAAFLANTAQLAYFTAFSYEFRVDKWFSSVGAVILLVVMVAIVTGCGWMIYRVSQSTEGKLVV